MLATAKAALFFGPGEPFETREAPMPDVEPDDVLIRVARRETTSITRAALTPWRAVSDLTL